MNHQDDRRRPPLYWFKHKHVEDMPLPFPPVSGVRPFCFSAPVSMQGSSYTDGYRCTG